ncbi:hypothetical protein GCM10010885_06320 [Alicyclobacillus cellulosilyticus]|uniref:Uncharacterized protein n=1 Tax=Alicyclobacillus cellulosilyticus TaxID=1003997 RepID=A0A917NGW7_9BACL|nr:hypothetical protein [Alicyclobacillus cellulosilyticus]GGI99778.1 hypothetical protein GCM10010885_06320 [Alicyclobacillus cellulosilyticus]
MRTTAEAAAQADRVPHEAQDRLIGLLALRYGLVPDSVQAAIRHIDDAKVLEDLIRRVESEVRARGFAVWPGTDDDFTAHVLRADGKHWS